MDVDVDGGMLRPETLLSSAIHEKGTSAPALSESITAKSEEEAEEARRAREAEEEIKKTSDALFAQHTNFDQVDGDEEEDGKSKVLGIKREDDVDTFPLRYPNPNEASLPWTGHSDSSAIIPNDDWSTDTPSTGPSSLRTIDEDPLQFVNSNALEKGTSSPFHTFLDLEDETHPSIAVVSTAPEGTSWCHRRHNASEIGLGVDLAMTNTLLKQE